MSFTLKKTDKVEEVAEFIASSILNKLKEGKRVLFFIPGGSAISVALFVAEILKKHRHHNLTIMLTDERYGPIDHFNSNFFQLKEKGFDLPQAKIIPILFDDDKNITIEKFNTNLKEELGKAEYKIGLFGIGVDGHTAGILPKTEAVECEELACGYDTSIYYRITMTEKAIEKLDEAIVYSKGEEKLRVIKDLEKDIDINIQPAQILKKVPLLTIFSDV